MDPRGCSRAPVDVRGFRTGRHDPVVCPRRRASFRVSPPVRLRWRVPAARMRKRAARAILGRSADRRQRHSRGGGRRTGPGGRRTVPGRRAGRYAAPGARGPGGVPLTEVSRAIGARRSPRSDGRASRRGPPGAPVPRAAPGAPSTVRSAAGPPRSSPAAPPPVRSATGPPAPGAFVRTGRPLSAYEPPARAGGTSAASPCTRTTAIRCTTDADCAARLFLTTDQIRRPETPVPRSPCATRNHRSAPRAFQARERAGVTATRGSRADVPPRPGGARSPATRGASGRSRRRRGGPGGPGPWTR